ncbi:hypothetical protein AAOE16_00760 [Ekhidna sp. MALMAid0563]|uniref:hypothetical protein n=1 Tax=Ekhidna sp. MALMAid0563 TaxID=3143937 RepID=UPI0032DF2483
MENKGFKSMLVLLMAACLLLTNCGDNSADPGIDCTASDLQLAVISFTKSDCQVPGSFEVSASGGEAPYEYSIDGVEFHESSVFSGVFAGTYIILVKDNQACVSEVSFTLESEPTGITLNLTSTNTTCGLTSGSVEANASGGTGSLMFSINQSTFSEETSFPNLAQGDYTVTVKGEEDCEVSKTIQVKTNTSLTTDIMPIIQNDCAITGCHNGSQNPRLTTEEEVIQNAGRIRSETQARTMPRDRTLSEGEIQLIACWVDDGALNN